MLLLTGDHINEKGIKYYDDLINLLLDNKLTPIVTLYHWDLPQVRNTLAELTGGYDVDVLTVTAAQILQEKYGGWQNVSLVNYFHDFANLCFERFGNRVKYWVTFSNPWVCQLKHASRLHVQSTRLL